jgi:hypothetical protein
VTRGQKDPLRELSTAEHIHLESISRARRAPAEAVTRAKLVLAVAGGMSYTDAAKSVGRKRDDAVSHLISRFNAEGIAALLPRHGGVPGEVWSNGASAYPAGM